MRRSFFHSESGVEMEFVWTKVGEGGRVVLPASYRKAMGLCVGDDILLEREGDEVRLRSRDGAIREVQRITRQYVPEGVSLVDELIAERRAEAARESTEEEEWRAKLGHGLGGDSGDSSV